MAFLQPRARVVYRFPPACVPEHYRAAAIFALGNGPLETAVGERMVFSAHRKALVERIEAGTFGDSPAQQDSIQFQPEVVMKTRGVVFLNEVAEFLLADFDATGRRFGGLVEIAFAAVFFECHFIPR